jgi:hypothetical protein
MINVGIVGCGRISDLHAKAYLTHPDAHINAICDPSLEALEMRGDLWGVPVNRRFQHIEELLLHDDIDMVDVLVPHNLHSDMANKVIASGKALSLQKPMTVNLEEANQLIKAAELAGTKFKVFENFIFFPPIAFAKELVDQGEIGDLLGIRMKSNSGISDTAWKIPEATAAWRLDPEKCEILSIGAVIEDTNNPLPLDQLPSFHVAIKRENITGSMFAINMNRDLIQIMSEYQSSGNDVKNAIEKKTGIRFLHEDEVVIDFYYFLYKNGLLNDKGNVPILNGQVMDHPIYGMVPSINQRTIPSGHINVAGKNFGTFDKVFLQKLPRWKQLIKMRSRILDPAILFVDWKSDDALPGLSLCKERSNVEGIVTHNALEDAIDVVAVLRTKY